MIVSKHRRNRTWFWCGIGFQPVLENLRTTSICHLLLISLVFCCQSMVYGQSEPTTTTPPVKRRTDFQRDIVPLLKEKCERCHQGEKAQNGFLILDRDAVLGLIEPGNAEGSSLFTDYLDQPSKKQDKESMVMPPDGPLSISQLALIMVWINEGADWQDPVEKAEPKRTSSFWEKLYLAIGYFHPAMVHFPIVLYAMSGACAFISFFIKPKFQTAAYQCLVLAAATSLVTAIMGWSFAVSQGFPAWDAKLAVNATHAESTFYYHRWCGTMLPVFGIGLALVGWSTRRNHDSKRLAVFWRIGAIVLALLVALVGHQGGELVYGDIFEHALEQLNK
jgi:uncharacterized membrane protein